MAIRELGFVKEILEEQGLELSHAYDDLVFVNNNAFLLQFDENPNILKLHINIDCEEDTANTIEKALNESASSRQMQIKSAGKYSLEAKEDTEEIQIKFFPQ